MVKTTFTRGPISITLAHDAKYEIVNITEHHGYQGYDVTKSMSVKDFEAKAASEFGMYGVAFLNRIKNEAFLSADQAQHGDPSAQIRAINVRYGNLKRKTTRAFQAYVNTLQAINA